MTFALAGFNIGQDVSLVIQSSGGDIVQVSDLGHLMDFDADATDVKLKVIPITNGGLPINQTIPAGWRGSLMFTRVNGALTQFIIDTQNAFFDSGIIQQFSLMASVVNRDSTVDEYLWSGVQFEDGKFGNFRTDKEVDQRLNFTASRLNTTGVSVSILTSLLAGA